MKQYANPPLVEAICDFHFEPGPAWDWTIPGLVYDRIRQDFPLKTQLDAAISVMFGMSPPAPNFPGMGRMQFRRADGAALVQLAPDNLTVNHLQPYPGWLRYREMIFNALAIYREVASPKGLRRVALRYINRIGIPRSALTEGSGAQIEDYVLSLPSVPESIPQTFSNWAQRIEIPLDSAPTTLILQSGTLPGDAASPVVFLLDLEISPPPQSPVALNAASEWIEQAHEHVDRIFEQCIGPKAKQLFESSHQETSA